MLRPIWSVTYLPLLDWPQYVAIVSVLRHYGDASYQLADYFVLDPALSTYMTFYYAATLFSYLMSVSSACKVLLSFYLLGTMGAAVHLLRSLDRSPWPALLVVIPLYNWPFFMGFIHFTLSLPLLMLGLSLVLRISQRATRARWAWLATVCALAFLTHALGYLILGALCLVLIPWLNFRRPRRVVLLCAAFIPSLLLFGVWAYGTFFPHDSTNVTASSYHGQKGSHLLKAEYRPRKQKIKEIPQDFNESFRGDDDRHATTRWYQWMRALLILGLLLWGWRRLRFQRYRQKTYLVTPILLTAAAGALFFLLPISYLNIWAISPRLVCVTALLAVAAIPPLFRREPLNALLFLPVLLFNLQSMATITHKYKAFQKETAGFDEVLAALPMGRRVYGLVYYQGSSVMSHAPFLHFPVYAMVKRGGLVGFTFFNNPSTPVRTRVPGQQPYPGLRGEWETRRWRYDIYWPYYDYLLVKPGYAAYWTGAPRGKLHQILRKGQWALYHNPAASKLRLAYSFHEMLPHAVVHESDGRELRLCRRTNARHQCPHADWSWVGPTEATLGKTYMPAIWAHPVRNKTIRISYDTGRTTGSRLIGVLGLASSAGSGTPVSLEIRVNGETLKTLRSGTSPGYSAFDITVPKERLPVRQVEFRITTANDGRRHFCFRAGLFRNTSR